MYAIIDPVTGLPRALTDLEKADVRAGIGAPDAADLDSVDNTPDVSKPVSALQAQAIATAPRLGVRLIYAGLGNSHMAATPGMLDAFGGVAPVVLSTNAGIGGNTSAMILARVGTDVPGDTRVCPLLEGTNDAIAVGATTLTLSQSMTNWRGIIANLQSRGIQPLLVLPPPAASTATYLWAVHQQRLAQLLLAEELLVPAYDPYRILIDPVTSGFITGASADGLHAVNAYATLVGQQLWADIAAGRLASLIPTCNADRGIAGVTANCLMLTATSGVPDGWVKGTQGVATTESAAADGVAGNWARLDATALTAAATLRSDRVLPRVSQASATLDRLHLQMALKFDPGANCSLTVGVEWRSADGVTLIGSTTLIGGLTTSVAPVRLQRRLTPPGGAALARVLVSVQATSGTYSGVVRVGEFRCISLSQARGLL